MPKNLPYVFNNPTYLNLLKIKPKVQSDIKIEDSWDR